MVTSDGDYHQFSPAHQTVVGTYLQLNSSNNKGENKRKATVTAFCVVANCPPPEIKMKRRGKEQEIYLITQSMNQGLCETVNYSDVNSSEFIETR